MDKHEQARVLYEKDGLSLAEISRRLGLNSSTVKTWKRRENWTKDPIERLEKEVEGLRDKIERLEAMINSNG